MDNADVFILPQPLSRMFKFQDILGNSLLQPHSIVCMRSAAENLTSLNEENAVMLSIGITLI